MAPAQLITIIVGMSSMIPQRFQSILARLAPIANEHIKTTSLYIELAPFLKIGPNAAPLWVVVSSRQPLSQAQVKGKNSLLTPMDKRQD
jgi:hypothetical protein